MKNINYRKYLAALVMMILLGSCNKEFLNIPPQDALTTASFYQSETQVRSATASLYGNPWSDFARRFIWLTGDLMSGNLYYTYLGNGEGQYLFFTVQPGNQNLSDGWTGLYRVVSYSNDIINTMPPIASSKGVSQDVINRALGEAHFMRGVAYFMLAELWGDVPIIENNTQVIASNNLNLPKNKKTSVYELIQRDLEFAAANLPTTDAQSGRVTQWSAKGMLAKLHLTIAQHLDGANQEFVDANSADNFNKAKSYAADVITNSGKILDPDYSHLFKIEGNNNQETLFSLQWIAASTYGGGGNGVETDWARNAIIAGIPAAYGGGKSFSYDFVQSVESGDARRSSIFMTKGDFYPEINKKAGGYLYNYVTVDALKNQIEGAAPVLNNIKKYVIGSSDDTGGQVVTNGTGQDQYILRLADVYLIYAEATLGAGSSTSDATALGYFNNVRQRANLSAKTSITFEDILKERRVEFAGEMMYWLDLKRYSYRDINAAVNKIVVPERLYSYTPVVNSTADPNTLVYYQVVPTPANLSSDIIKTQLNLPVPSNEVVNDPALGPEVASVDYVFH